MDTYSEATGELVERLGAAQVSTRPADLYSASMDNLRYSRLPAAVVRPADEESVAAVLELANHHKVPVTPRGAGSATTGAASPAVGGWVIDFSDWRQLHVDPVARMAYVQPGVVLADLDAAAAEHGLMYPPDPGSSAYATVGGTIATNAGGLRGAKYGVTRDYVLALEGFLPTGGFVRWGANLRKYASGYNIRDLWIGAEGTLGVLTGAVLRLVPRPPARSTCLALFRSNANALESAQQLLQDGLTPSALEFLDSATVSCTLAFWKKKDPKLLATLPACLQDALGEANPPAALLVEADGADKEVAAQLERIEQRLSASASAFSSATEPASATVLWKLRRSCSQAMFELGPRKLNEDVVVPFENQIPLLNFVEQLGRDTGLATPTFGHAADGNFHVHIMYDDADPDQKAAARKGIQALMEEVVALGGAISGEHGIGLAKSPFFALQHSEAEIGAMRAIKQALDPAGILNPGKLWIPSEPWDFPREKVRMPWDH